MKDYILGALFALLAVFIMIYSSYLILTKESKVQEIIISTPKTLKGEDQRSKDIRRVIELTNIERKKNNLKELIVNEKLMKAAQEKADEMVLLGYFKHVSPAGKNVQSFVDPTGYKYYYLGENLARNFKNVDLAFAKWLTSESHRSNILDSDYIHIGVGINGTTIVQIFGTPAYTLIPVFNK